MNVQRNNLHPLTTGLVTASYYMIVHVAGHPTDRHIRVMLTNPLWGGSCPRRLGEISGLSQKSQGTGRASFQGC